MKNDNKKRPKTAARNKEEKIKSLMKIKTLMKIKC